MAVPGCCPFEVRLGRHKYVDGGTVNPLPARVFIGEKLEKTAAILTKPVDCENEPPKFLERKIFWRYFHRHRWMLEKLWEAGHLYNEEVFFLEDLADDERSGVFIICPDKMPPARFLTTDKEQINRSIDMGYEKAARLEKGLRKFMAPPFQ